MQEKPAQKPGEPAPRPERSLAGGGGRDPGVEEGDVELLIGETPCEAGLTNKEECRNTEGNSLSGTRIPLCRGREFILTPVSKMRCDST